MRRYQQGEEATVRFLTKDGSGVPAAPDAAPTLTVYSPSGATSYDRKVPAEDRAAVTGLFRAKVFLGSAFSTAGRYTAYARWAVGGTQFGSLTYFDVVAGGSDTGQVIAMHNFERPHTSFLVQQRTSGQVFKGRAPRAS